MAGVNLTIEDCFEDDESPRKKTGLTQTSMNTENDRSRERLLTSLVADGTGKGRARGTHVPKWVLRLIANSTDALVFSQLYYWLDRGNKPQPKRGLLMTWVAKSAVDLAQELHRTENEVVRSYMRLRKRGFIDWKNRKFGGKKQRHISIMWNKVQLAYEQVKQELFDKAHR